MIAGKKATTHPDFDAWSHFEYDPACNYHMQVTKFKDKSIQKCAFSIEEWLAMSHTKELISDCISSRSIGSTASIPIR